MRAQSYWHDFPITYRAEQVAEMAGWLAAEESGVLVGGSGTGKSNLVGFLAARPDALTGHLGSAARPLCLLHFDLNSLPALNQAYVYRGMIETLTAVGRSLRPGLPEELFAGLHAPMDWRDDFFVFSTLLRAHQLLLAQDDLYLVWLLDRFDAALQRLDVQALNSLRSLRDSMKGRLSFVVATREPLERLRNPADYDEFYELVAANTCWVGPMIERDARWITEQMAERLQTTFSPAQVQRMIQVTGGLPAFMKAATIAAAEIPLDGRAQLHEWVHALLARPEFRRNCREIWQDLRPEEQAILAAVAAGGHGQEISTTGMTYLQQSGLLVRDGARPAIFSPLFARYVQDQRSAPGAELRLDPAGGQVTRGGVPLESDLTGQEHLLLRTFLARAGEICTKDDLMAAVWPEDQVVEGVRDDRLAQLIKRLREKIEPDPGNPVYVQTIRGRGYRFVQPEE